MGPSCRATDRRHHRGLHHDQLRAFWRERLVALFTAHFLVMISRRYRRALYTPRAAVRPTFLSSAFRERSTHRAVRPTFRDVRSTYRVARGTGVLFWGPLYEFVDLYPFRGLFFNET